MKNKETEEIYKTVKRKISISNFVEEEKVDMVKNKNSIFKSIAIASCMIISVTGVVFAKDIGNFISNLFGDNASDGVKTAVVSLKNKEATVKSSKHLDENVVKTAIENAGYIMI